MTFVIRFGHLRLNWPRRPAILMGIRFGHLRFGFQEDLVGHGFEVGWSGLVCVLGRSHLLVLSFSCWVCLFFMFLQVQVPLNRIVVILRLCFLSGILITSSVLPLTPLICVFVLCTSSILIWFAPHSFRLVVLKSDGHDITLTIWIKVTNESPVVTFCMKEFDQVLCVHALCVCVCDQVYSVQLLPSAY